MSSPGPSLEIRVDRADGKTTTPTSAKRGTVTPRKNGDGKGTGRRPSKEKNRLADPRRQHFQHLKTASSHGGHGRSRSLLDVQALEKALKNAALEEAPVTSYRISYYDEGEVYTPRAGTSSREATPLMEPLPDVVHSVAGDLHLDSRPSEVIYGTGRRGSHPPMPQEAPVDFEALALEVAETGLAASAVLDNKIMDQMDVAAAISTPRAAAGPWGGAEAAVRFAAAGFAAAGAGLLPSAVEIGGASIEGESQAGAGPSGIKAKDGNNEEDEDEEEEELGQDEAGRDEVRTSCWSRAAGVVRRNPLHTALVCGLLLSATGVAVCYRYRAEIDRVVTFRVWRLCAMGFLFIAAYFASRGAVTLVSILLDKYMFRKSRLMYVIIPLKRPVTWVCWSVLSFAATAVVFQDRPTSGGWDTVYHAALRVFGVICVNYIGTCVAIVIAKTMAANFHKKAYFDLIQEGLVKEYILSKLSSAAPRRHKRPGGRSNGQGQGWDFLKGQLQGGRRTQLNKGASLDTMSAAGVSTASLMSSGNRSGSGGAGDMSGRESPTAFFREKGAKVEWQTSNHLSKTKDLLESAEERKRTEREHTLMGTQAPRPESHTSLDALDELRPQMLPTTDNNRRRKDRLAGAMKRPHRALRRLMTLGSTRHGNDETIGPVPYSPTEAHKNDSYLHPTNGFNEPGSRSGSSSDENGRSREEVENAIHEMERYARKENLRYSLADKIEGKLTSRRHARLLGGAIYRKLKRPSAPGVEQIDLVGVLPEDLVEKAWSMLDTQHRGRVSLRRMRDWAESVYNERRSLAFTLSDAKTIVSKLENIIKICVKVVVVLVSLAIFNVDILSLWLTFSSTILAFAFVFGNSVRSVYEAVVFLFVTHAYDVNDSIWMDDSFFEVEKIDLLTTTFQRWDGKLCIYTNQQLAQKSPLVNTTRSWPAGQVLQYHIDIEHCTDENLRALHDGMNEYLGGFPAYFKPGEASAYAGGMSTVWPGKVQINFYALYTMNGHDLGMFFRAKSIFCIGVVDCLKKLKISFTLPPQAPYGRSDDPFFDAGNGNPPMRRGGDTGDNTRYATGVAGGGHLGAAPAPALFSAGGEGAAGVEARVMQAAAANAYTSDFQRHMTSSSVAQRSSSWVTGGGLPGGGLGSLSFS